MAVSWTEIVRELAVDLDSDSGGQSLLLTDGLFQRLVGRRVYADQASSTGFYVNLLHVAMDLCDYIESYGADSYPGRARQAVVRRGQLVKIEEATPGHYVVESSSDGSLGDLVYTYVPDPKALVRALETLTGDDRLDVSAIKNLTSVAGPAGPRGATGPKGRDGSIGQTLGLNAGDHLNIGSNAADTTNPITRGKVYNRTWAQLQSGILFVSGACSIEFFGSRAPSGWWCHVVASGAPLSFNSITFTADTSAGLAGVSLSSDALNVWERYLLTISPDRWARTLKDQGRPGLQGRPGRPGSTGATGPAGRDGRDGSDGARGPKGDPGSDGARGPVGPAGSPGARGSQGPAGTDGKDGARGPIGPQGAQGQRGEKGEKGDPGSKGDPGQPGSKGDKGDPGAQGAQGPQGQTGQRGPKGDKGDPGNTGPAGPQGPQGPAGSGGVVGHEVITLNEGKHLYISSNPDGINLPRNGHPQANDTYFKKSYAETVTDTFQFHGSSSDNYGRLIIMPDCNPGWKADFFFSSNYEISWVHWITSDATIDITGRPRSAIRQGTRGSLMCVGKVNGRPQISIKIYR